MSVSAAMQMAREAELNLAVLGMIRMAEHPLSIEAMLSRARGQVSRKELTGAVEALVSRGDLEAIGAEEGDQPLTYGLMPEGKREPVGDPAPRRQNIRRQLLAALDDTPASTNEVAERAGLSDKPHTTIRATLANAMRYGQCTRVYLHERGAPHWRRPTDEEKAAFDAKHRPHKRTPLADQVMDVLVEAGEGVSLSAAEIAERLNMSRKRLASPLTDLRRKQKVEKLGRGKKTRWRVAGDEPATGSHIAIGTTPEVKPPAADDKEALRHFQDIGDELAEARVRAGRPEAGDSWRDHDARTTPLAHTTIEDDDELAIMADGSILVLNAMGCAKVHITPSAVDALAAFRDQYLCGRAGA